MNGHHVPVGPVAIGSIDIDGPDATPYYFGDDRLRYDRARLLVREEGLPLGVVEVPIVEGEMVTASLADALERLPAVTRRPGPSGPTGRHMSVVVTACTASPSLKRCLRSILASRHPSFDVIVVNNRPAAAMAIRQDLERSFGRHGQLRLIDEPRQGLSTARNAGLAAAQGSIVVFTDDDVVVDPHWLERLDRAFDSGADVACVTGLILPLALDDPSQVLLEQFASFGKGFERREFRLAEIRRHDPLFPYTAGQVGTGANTAVRAEVARSIGGFDPVLGAGTPTRGAEDLDIFIRLLQTRHTVVYEPAAVIFHEHPRGEGRLARQVFSYGTGLGALLAKHAVHGIERGYLLRVAPKALRYLRDPASRKNRGKGPVYPRRLTALEHLGMVYGALTYLLRTARPRGEAAAQARKRGCDAVWVTEVDVASGIADLKVPSRCGQPYAEARVLVRDAGRPRGFVAAAIENGRVSARAIREAVEEMVVPPDCQEPPIPSSIAPSAVSVVVCTRDREESLRAALSSILHATGSPAEIIVVDSAPKTDATRRVLQELDDHRLRYVVERRPGLSRARNRGIAAARGDVIAFTDDDVVVDHDWISGLLRGFDRDTAVGCVTGLVPAAELESAAQRFFDSKVQWANAFTPRLFDLRENRVDSPLYPFAAGVIGTGANFAIRREALERIGHFDEALGAGAAPQGGEDLDFFLRTLLAGWAIAYEPAALVWHVHRRELEALGRQLYGYGAGLSAYLWKHLASPRTRRHMLRSLAPAIVHFVHTGSPARRAVGIPRRVQLHELRGLIVGPFAYWRARRRDVAG